MSIHDLTTALAITRPDWAKDAYRQIEYPATRKYPAKPTRLRIRRHP